MFAHAWFQHKDVFWTLENQEGIYMFYKTVCDIYQLIPEENYTIPPEAEGLAMEEEHQTRRGQISPEFTIQQKPSTLSERTPLTSQTDESIAQTTISTGATTRRHKHTPSTGSFPVTTIAEGDEDVEESKEAEPLLDRASNIDADPAIKSKTEAGISETPNDPPPPYSQARESMESKPDTEEPRTTGGDLEKQMMQEEERDSEEFSEKTESHDTEELSEKVGLHDTESKDSELPPKEG